MTLVETAMMPEALAYLAGGLYVVGFAITNQIVLRLLVLVGTGAYILYYATVDDRPLWEAIYVSLLIGTATLGGLFSLIARRSRLAIPRLHADIYKDFPALPPGDFRALSLLAKRYTLTEDKQVTTESMPGHTLFYVVRGATLVRKGEQAFVLPPKIFLGEIAFLTNAPSSATTWLEAGSEVLEWRFDTLRRKCDRSPRFKLALEAAISNDLAQKVARSMGQNAVPVEEIPAPMIRALAGVRPG